LLSQKALAKAAGVSTVTISFIENDLIDPKDLTKTRLAKFFMIPVEEIFPLKNVGVESVK